MAKTAGRAPSDTLLPLAGLVWDVSTPPTCLFCDVPAPLACLYGSDLWTPSEPAEVRALRESADAWLFTVVRDPLTRLISAKGAPLVRRKSGRRCALGEA